MTKITNIALDNTKMVVTATRKATAEEHARDKSAVEMVSVVTIDFSFEEPRVTINCCLVST